MRMAMDDNENKIKIYKQINNKRIVAIMDCSGKKQIIRLR